MEYHVFIKWKIKLIEGKICGVYYKHVTIVNYASSCINKLRASLNDNARVVIYDRHMFIVKTTERVKKTFLLKQH
jgi:hypothetical protein